MAGLQDHGPVDCSLDIDGNNIRRRTAIVTGGANGIGKAYTRALVAAGADVTIGDLNAAGGERLVSEFPGKVHFVKCDVTSWHDQARLLREAASFSPTNQVHFVVANAGMIRQDEVFAYAEEPMSQS
ncbi:uncharacterized protein A1O9_03617 [Exophiala aquamarina CBS 119918]|uniref:3-oxoacyl-[acyl-carrier protein] reductase n=1 Tax=Exophiala aquamarina CBS 119918 TaxID=1182545 RepID=A0A072PFB9_9EURO|nr:uncharacterized protein A1O9_03617 [Exophiala aquamarina CBS 119918]KEF58774.1 hypothetical protein A1O9_03617 [Exophiala aquamarina CBS 119918]